ncbi:ParB N-terminal domain-containing protein [Lentzea sp. BCCO 10_0798]|uniref:ParB N-terminal domain-containing protein n=1 Tax=Lentzea kristufekii TaxID=3095430 RepID=A0ABU4TQ74_9PSEU|nr:ParB N-terminal domain-containing protein [Lentzea sp. BCCO 10_0798]MDX8050425.1 ParB N-terminal domain-containing protein [Lentzea sp. BCCO 10_0798]
MTTSRTSTAIVRRELSEAKHLRTGRVSPDRLRIHGSNLHRDVGDLRELADSLKVDGVLEPIVVQQRGDMIEVVDGRRRTLAARLARLRSVPVIWQDPRTDDEIVALTVTTDVHKKRMSPQERQHCVQQLRAAGWSIQDIAERFGKATSTIYGWLAGAGLAAADAAADEPVTATPASSSPVPSSSAPRPRREGKRPPAWAQSLHTLVGRWETRCGPDGLGLDETALLLQELRALTSGVTS